MANTVQNLRQMKSRQEWVEFYNTQYIQNQRTMKDIAISLNTSKSCLRQVLQEVGITLKQGRPKQSRKFKGDEK